MTVAVEHDFHEGVFGSRLEKEGDGRFFGSD